VYVGRLKKKASERQSNPVRRHVSTARAYDPLDD
jgi:hypothetical protein